MSTPQTSLTSRRDFLKRTAHLTAASSAIAGVVGTSKSLAQTAGSKAASAPAVHPGGGDTIQVALVGCGGRGGGAVNNALATTSGPIKLVAMADVFDAKLKACHKQLTTEVGSKMDVPSDRQFVGFDAYKQAMDTLKPGDVVILTTPPAFRWPHFTYAIEKGLNVFMEKPVTVDGPSSRRMLKLNESAQKKNLKVGVGLMIRHCRIRQELFDRIQNGAIGDIITLRAYRMHGPAGHCFAGPRPGDISELLYQVQEFHSFLWASGGLYSDFYIHNIDECCWMKNAWPIKAQALGGRNYRGDAIDQNFDTYAVEYTFADGAKLFLDGRTMTGCFGEFASYAQGSKGAAVISTASHNPAKSRLYKGQNMTAENLLWRAPKEEPNPYQTEWDDLIVAIRENKPYNEVKRGVEASLVCSMGRMAAHTGQVIEFDEMLNCPDEFAPTVGVLTMDSPAPLQLAANGRYPIPEPGIKNTREY